LRSGLKTLIFLVARGILTMVCSVLYLAVKAFVFGIIADTNSVQTLSLVQK